MPKQPRLTAQEAESMLLKAGFVLLRSKGSHHIYLKDNQLYLKDNQRIILPFHAGKILHPKIAKQVLDAVE